MEIYKCKKLIVLKYFEIGSKMTVNGDCTYTYERVDYTRYICTPYTRKRSMFIKEYMHHINEMDKAEISKLKTKKRLTRKFITGKENIKEYIERLKHKVTNTGEAFEPITARFFDVDEKLPHEDARYYDFPMIIGPFGEHTFYDYEKIGTDIRKL